MCSALLEVNIKRWHLLKHNLSCCDCAQFLAKIYNSVLARMLSSKTSNSAAPTTNALSLSVLSQHNYRLELLEEVVSPSHHPTPDSSPELTKRSWFGSLMSTDKDETYTVIVRGKPLASIKAAYSHLLSSNIIYLLY